jgi:ribosomal protein S18 acetylase RimI-like enzyme
MLGDPKNIHIFLTKNNKSIGYVFGKPHNEMLEELQADDVDLKSKTDFFYLESIQILPEARGTGGARKLLETFCEEAKKKSFVKFSIHARTSNGFSQMVKKVFAGKMLKERRIERWKYGGDEPYEYLEWGI